MTKNEAGRLGGLAVLNRYGPEFFVHIGRLGGRPRSVTLAELQSQQAARRQRRIDERRSRLPGGDSLRTLRGLLGLKIDMGELALMKTEAKLPQEGAR